jgi:hypothetical protein
MIDALHEEFLTKHNIPLAFHPSYSLELAVAFLFPKLGVAKKRKRV